MRRTSPRFALLISIILLIAAASCSTSIRDISAKYSQQQISLQNMANSVRQVVGMRPATNMPYYLALVFSPPDDGPLAMLNMLHLTQKSLLIVNTWPDSRRNYTLSKPRNCIDYENILIFASRTKVLELFSKVNATCTGARVELLVAISEELTSDDDAKKFAKTIVDFAWEQLRAYAIILISVDSRILALRSEKHMSYVRCRPEPPRIISYWDNGTLIGNLSFESLRHNECVIRIAMGTCGLLSRVVIADGQERMEGIESQILQAIAEMQNYTIAWINAKPPNSGEFGIAVPEAVLLNSTRVKKKLESYEADLGSCSMWISYQEDLKYSFSYSTHYLVLVIPIPSYIPFTSILQTFSNPLWICIVVGCIMGRVLIRMNQKSIPTLIALGLFLGVPVASKSRGFVEKWQMILWVIYGYLITQSYIASLASVLNNPRIKRIQTIEELAESDIKVAGYTPQSEIFKVDDKYKHIVETYVNVEEPEHTRMMNNPDEILLDVRRTGILIDVLLLNSHRWLSRYYQLKERIAYQPLGMAVMSRSKISLNEIDRTIASLVESGLVSKWTGDDFLPPGSSQTSSDIGGRSSTLSLEEVSGIFVILVAGLSLSIIVFIFEVCRRKVSENNSRPPNFSDRAKLGFQKSRRFHLK